ncbi:hypothetical protein LAJ19_05940 [Deinococcus taeanensis]|uniref:AAA family ATPase n=1 Tax=Deinococcus taeanensis TaxID=2737050 RepID=UPI001CDC28A8|nr:hypothetical protein [Deinococcus taeanensis]UBV43753.1 hypothetical protein LAJ19_05940 [Deinococcus taeanensis]
MNWKAALADLRAHLPPGGGGVTPGSLRWLEAQMEARGAKPGTVRNIVYRDVGSAADKAALRGLLLELAREAGRTLPDEGHGPVTRPAAELELLGRSKKRAFRQFTAGVRAGRAPRLIVSGRAGAGKTVLLSRVERALRDADVAVRQVFLSGAAGDVLVPRGPIGSSFAAQAQAQLDAARALLPQDGALLVRVTADLQPLGGPPRLPDGAVTDAATWAAHALLRRAPAGVAVLLAVEGDVAGAPGGEVIELKPPTPTEARAFLMTRLGVTRAEAERLVKETGRHLDRLTLLANVAGDGVQVNDLLADPETRRLVEVTAALAQALPGQLTWPDGWLSAALGQAASALPPHARALLLGSADAGWRATPALSRAWRAVSGDGLHGPLRHLSTLDTAHGQVQVGALAALGHWEALAALVRDRPDEARHLPALWPKVRTATGEAREVLARAVVMHHAGRGEYNEPRARDALFTLMESPRAAVRAWARVKLAESSLEAGRMDAAHAQLNHPDVTGRHGPDPWEQAAQADALLVHAALARWRGDLEEATRAASDPRLARGGPRALLWRGLIAKDAGRWTEALAALQAVPAASPLLSARARYQEGDLLLRLGRPLLAFPALQEAAARLERAGGAPEERARVLARTATALRRLGDPARGQNVLTTALDLVPADDRRHVDGVPRARLLSEGVPLLLALGQPEAALRQAAQALELLARSESRPAEAQYRERRTRYRVALAYLTRGLGVPYMQPFRGPAADHADLRQARVLLDDLLSCPAGGADRESMLHFDMRLSRALAEPDAALAVSQVQRALDLATHPYEEAQARGMLAEAHLRAGQDTEALGHLNRAYALVRRLGLPGEGTADPGLQAQLLALEVRLTAHEGPVALTWLRDALREPPLAPFRAGVWREAGRAVEDRCADPWAVLRAWGVTLDSGVWRAADALCVHELSEAEPA